MDLSLYSLIKKFLDKQNYQVNPGELKLQLLSHPNYPSLHSVTGLLNHFGIENLALEVPKNHSTLMELPEIFLSITLNKEYVLVQKRSDHIHVLFENNDTKNFSLDEFFAIWTGVVVGIEKKALATTNAISSSKMSIFYYLLAFSVIAVFFITKPTVLNSAHFILSLTGLTISAFIIKHELGYTSKTIEKLCSSNKSTSCDAVLNSDGASLSKNIKLSDACLVYFASLVLYWTLSQLNHIPQAIIIAPILLAIPVTLYSIYYQYMVIKKWCPLCLGIIGVLWLQSSLFINRDLVQYLNFEILDGFTLLISFLFTISAWGFARPFINENLELNKLRISHYKFIRNFDLFYTAFNKSKTVDTNIDQIGNTEIVLGNVNAPLRLLMVTNPECFYCKEAHSSLEKILRNHPHDISVTIRFNVNVKSGHLALKVAHRLLELYNSADNESFHNAFSEVYSKEVNLEKWIQKWGEGEASIHKNILEKQSNWCRENGVNFTPVIYINNRPFPDEYEWEHLPYFIEDLAEQFEVPIDHHMPSLAISDK